MGRKTVRLEVRLTPELYSALQRTSQQHDLSMGEVVREAVQEYVTAREVTHKQALLRQLVDLQAPVDDWDVMKEQINASLSAALGDSRGPSGEQRGDSDETK